MKGNGLKFILKSGDLPMAWLHGSYKVQKMVNINWRYIEHNNRCSPDNFEFHCLDDSNSELL